MAAPAAMPTAVPTPGPTSVPAAPPTAAPTPRDPIMLPMRETIALKKALLVAFSTILDPMLLEAAFSAVLAACLPAAFSAASPATLAAAFSADLVAAFSAAPPTALDVATPAAIPPAPPTVALIPKRSPASSRRCVGSIGPERKSAVIASVEVRSHSGIPTSSLFASPSSYSALRAAA